jgi:phosphatidylglycerophosphate synthase
MRLRVRRILAVQLISISRLAAALVFSAIAFQPYPIVLVVGIYLVAAFSDLLDGFMARKLAVSSFAGTAIDLISDKALTVVSLLYAAAKGVAIFPLAVIAAREFLSLGLRLIEVNGKQLLPTSRLFGGAMAATLWGNTALFIVAGDDDYLRSWVTGIYWMSAGVLAVNFVWRLVVSRDRIMSVLVTGSERDRAPRKP